MRVTQATPALPSRSGRLCSAPEGFGCLGFTALIIVGILLIFLRGTAHFDDSSCAFRGTWRSHSAAVAAGLAGGSLLLVCIIFASNPSMRGSPMRSAAIVLAACVVRFGASASDLSPIACIHPLGGTALIARPQEPLEFVFWIFVTVPEFSALACVAGRRLSDRVIFSGVLGVLFLTGGVASFMESLATWVPLVVASFVAHFIATAILARVFWEAYEQGRDAFTRLLTAIVSVITLVIWMAFPVLWLLGQFAVVSPELEHSIWPILDLAAKKSVVFVLVFGCYQGDARSIEQELAMLDAQRKAAEARDQAKRVFMRYILHQMRSPLQGGQLAVEELQHGLQSGELLVSATSIEACGAAQRTNDLTSAVTLAVTSTAPRESASAALATYMEAADTASSAMGAMGKLLDDFLALARIEAGRLEVELADINVAAWLRELVALFASALRVKRIQLHVAVAPDVSVSLRTDGMRLRQIVSTYLSNALKFSPSGSSVSLELIITWREPLVVSAPVQSGEGVHSGIATSDVCLNQADVHGSRSNTPEPTTRPLSFGSVSRQYDAALGFFSRSSTARPFLRISVADRGPGISRSEIPLLFQPFVHLHAGESQKGVGTGLGLALCKSLADLLEGAVGVDSEAGRGATFWVEVPFAAAKASPRGDAAEGATLVPVPTRSTFSTIEHRQGVLQLDRVMTQAHAPRAPLVAVFRDTTPRPQTETQNAAPFRENSARALPSSHTDGCMMSPRESASPSAALVQLTGASAHDGQITSHLKILDRVVVVDDVQSNRQLFARLLRRAGAQVVFVAEHGLDCLAQLRALLNALSTGAPRHDIVGDTVGAVSPEPSDDECKAAHSPGDTISTLMKNSVADCSPPGTISTARFEECTTQRTPWAHDLADADSVIDVWFVDGNMPVMDGLELTRSLRQAGVCAPIIAVTGNALKEDQTSFIAAGASAVLTKPCSTTMLHSKLAQLGFRLPQGPTGEISPGTLASIQS